LNNHLLNHTFLVGNSITLADIILSLTVYDLYVHVLTADLCRANSNVTRWFLTLVTQPEFSSILGKSSFHANSHLSGLISKAKPVQSIHQILHAQNRGVEDHAEEHDEEDEHEHEEGKPAGQIVKKEKKKRNQIVSHQAPAAPVAHVHSRKLTEQDLMSKAIPSIYHSPHPTKSLSHQKTSGSPKAGRSIQQPSSSKGSGGKN